MKHWKSILGIGLVFGLGMILGGLLTARLIDHRIRAFAQRGPEAVVELVGNRLNRELRLDASQRAGVATAIATARGRLKDARHEVQPRVDEALALAEQDIRALLRPDQNARFDAILSRVRERWAK